jgi:WD40 repeat protein
MGTHIATGSHDGTVRVARVDGGRAVVLEGHDRAAIIDVAFSRDGRHVVSVGDDETLRVWDLDGDRAPRAHRQQGGFASAAFSADGEWINARTKWGTGVVTATGGGNAIELERANSTARNPTDDLIVTWLDDAPSGESRAGPMSALSSSGWGTVHVWPARGRGAPFALEGHESSIRAIAQDRAQSRVAAGAQDGTARIWPIDWSLLIDYLDSATTVCLEPADRERLLGESPEEAESRYRQCEHRRGRR